jgi:hypothetical protein
VTWVTALILMTLALPALLERLPAGISRILARSWRLCLRSPPRCW